MRNFHKIELRNRKVLVVGLGITGLSDNEFLIGRRPDDHPNKGQVLLARADDEKGMMLIT